MINYDLEAQQAAALDDNTYIALAEYVKKQDYQRVLCSLGADRNTVTILYDEEQKQTYFEFTDVDEELYQIILLDNRVIEGDYRQELIPVFTLAVALHNQVMKSEKGLMNDKA